MSTLSFTTLSDTYPGMDPLRETIPLDPSKEDLKKAVLVLLKKYNDKYFPKEYYPEGSPSYLLEGELKEDNVDNIVNDLFHVQQYVSNCVNKYYSVVFAIDQAPCIVAAKGRNKRIYKWENKP